MVSTPCCCPCELVAAVCLYFYNVFFHKEFVCQKQQVLINNVESNCRSWTVLLVKTFLSCYIHTQITKRKHKIVVSDKETQAKNPKTLIFGCLFYSSIYAHRISQSCWGWDLSLLVLFVLCIYHSSRSMLEIGSKSKAWNWVVFVFLFCFLFWALSLSLSSFFDVMHIWQWLCCDSIPGLRESSLLCSRTPLSLVITITNHTFGLLFTTGKPHHQAWSSHKTSLKHGDSVDTHLQFSFFQVVGGRVTGSQRAEGAAGRRVCWWSALPRESSNDGTMIAALRPPTSFGCWLWMEPMWWRYVCHSFFLLSLCEGKKKKSEPLLKGRRQ